MTELTPLYDKSCQCMMCKKSFTTKKIRSRFVKVKEYESDFKPVYESVENNPLLYYINVCPHCGFSFSDDFSPFFPPGAKKTITEKVSNKWVPHEFGHQRSIGTSINAYKLGSYCATLKKEKHIIVAGIYMRLAWLYRALNNGTQEQRFMKLAVHEYKESFTADDFQGTQVSETRLLYLIGELSRRIGDEDQAVKYFSKVIEKQSGTTEPTIIEMARERWHEIRDARKQAEGI
ncbi:DUF2225 domain-containing protein [Bacillus sp. V3-13]|uniref:DUF2225 domain-containing protein n=1 Tax=Bacillus sp. V3-13 TaxID=2053728 RepID=UPI000C77E414|nr:DUF2225 domain-containing protein [Bacillus sp. V3-13]PLR79402.1 DUF2225 domain-containing protein [Bacillus sp. V3-13]